MDKSQLKWLYISVGFSLAVLVVILLLTINENTITYLTQINPWFLLLAFLTHLLTMCFWAMRVKMMAGSLGYRVGFWYSLNLVFANLLASAITPAQAGGEPVRVHELYKANVPLGDATAVVIMERVLDGIALAALAAFSMIVLTDQWKQLGTVSEIMVFVTWIFVAGCLFLFYLAIRRPDVVKRVVARCTRWLTRTWENSRVESLLVRADKEIDNFQGSTVRFVHTAKGGLVWGMIFTLLYWVSEIITASLILVGLGQPPLILESFVIQLILAILMMLPLTPGSSGIAEVGATSMYALFLPAGVVGIFVVLWRIVLYYFNIALGILSSIIIVRREARACLEEGNCPPPPPST
ncbi:flippase-like domain-containing protein [Methanoregula sp.]|uniref:lysylphosphatidylglycerol synthase transmembrane domain-containing protein n=1 Tax=Methanoregula sp. TaxID=2052170 RepID=UPI002604797F|nr:flippase-like domain-containing protein [Methanoregula sp.]MDD5143449.1 flippase-like domain-containing protein [Methanoregula sp.]